MSQTRRLMLIALMLFSFTGIFIGLAGTAMAVVPDGPNGPNGPGGEFCGGDTGFPCPTPANPAPAPTTAPEQQPAPPITSTSEDKYKEGYEAGKEAGKTGAPNVCRDDPFSDYCKGWNRGYEEGRRKRPLQPGQSTPSLPKEPSDGIPTILKVAGIVGAILIAGLIATAVVMIIIPAIEAAAAAAEGEAIAAAVESAVATVSKGTKAIAHFFGKKP